MRNVLLVPIILLMFLGCRKSSDVNLDIDNSKLEISTIWSSNKYLAFTDLVNFKDKWYCVFREATSHTSYDGVLKIMVSNDAQNWRLDTILKVKGMDLRDPKFSFGLNDGLLLNAGARDSVFKSIIWHYNDSEKTWGEYDYTDASGDWLWTIRRRAETLFSVAYKYNKARTASEISLFSSDKHTFPKFQLYRKNLIDKGCPTESSFMFMNNDSIIILARRDCGDRCIYMGTGHYPFENLNWASMHIILESPNIITINGEIYVAGRYYNPNSRTSLFKLSADRKSLIKLTDLPSGPDSGYPGMVHAGNYIYISYYSVDKHGRAAINLGKYNFAN